VGVKLLSPVRVIALSLALALVLALAAHFAAGGAHVPAPTGTLVREADFRHLDSNGPGALVLRWWQANQFHRPLRAVDAFYAASDRPTVAALRSDLKVVSYFFDETKPFVLDEYVTGDTAQVFALIPRPRKAVSDSNGLPYVFRAVREGGRWKLADNFIAALAQREREYAAQEAGR
jgi:hypothetical protein